jgi:hypothetical protein
MLNDIYEDYLIDLIDIIKPEVQRAMKMYNELSDRQNDDPGNFGYVTGYAHAYSRIVSLMLQQAEAYDIPLSKLSLDDINPDKDLMPGV